MRVVVGLGNPGDKYKKTRHNAGFMTVDFLAKKKLLVWKTSKKFKAQIAEDGNTIYVKPLTFMNESGQSVQAVLSYYKLLSKKLGLIFKKDQDLNAVLTVIHDDLDIKLGDYKIVRDRNSAGHRGVDSIINYLKTKKFERIRIGIKNELLEKIPVEKFVLDNFKKEELNTIDILIAEIAAKI